MSHRIVVLAKQVPDTKNITARAMKADGTVNRAALPAIFNPDDLAALELALQLKERYGGTVTVITMGLPSASNILREALYRGADRVVLVTDSRLAASDTLATSYALHLAVKRLGEVDLVLCGRQAIDGDTAQVGPQVAQKLGLPQITYVREVCRIESGMLEARREMGAGYEVMRGKLPLLLTVSGESTVPRPAAAKLMLRYRKARSQVEIERELRPQGQYEDPDRAQVEQRARALRKKGLLIEQWNADAIGADLERIGLSGSATRVKRIEYVVLDAAETKSVKPTESDLTSLMQELISDHTLD